MAVYFVYNALPAKQLTSDKGSTLSSNSMIVASSRIPKLLALDSGKNDHMSRARARARDIDTRMLKLCVIRPNKIWRSRVTSDYGRFCGGNRPLVKGYVGHSNLKV